MAKRKNQSQTTAQVIVDYFTGEFLPENIGRYEDYRKMRSDPTIALCRWFSAAPILASSWSVEGTDPDHQALIEEELLPVRSWLLRTALYGLLDFGWKAYELVYEPKCFEFPVQGERTICGLERIKALKHENTWPRYRKRTGDFIGFAHEDLYLGHKVFIDESHSLFLNFDDEGIGEFALGNAEIAKKTYEEWNHSNEQAARYDQKISGTFLVVEYPVGTSLFEGKETSNAEIAANIAKDVSTSRTVMIPKRIQDTVDSLQKETKDWDIYFLEPQTRQASFVDRQKYLDALKCRAYAIPERSIIEGEFGTKAEAGIHASAALLNMQLRHEMITQFLNAGYGCTEGLVNRLLRVNFNSKGTAWLKAVPMTDERMGLFTQLLTSMIADPGSGPELMDRIDADEMVHAMGIPTREEEDGSGEESPSGSSTRITVESL